MAAALWGSFGVAAAAGYSVTATVGSLGCLGFALVAGAGSMLCYRAAIPVNAQFGELFKAVFDVYGSRPSASKELFDARTVLDLVAAVSGVPAGQNVASHESYLIAWRYLHNYRIKCPVCGASVPAPQCRAHVAAHTPIESEQVQPA